MTKSLSLKCDYQLRTPTGIQGLLILHGFTLASSLDLSFDQAGRCMLENISKFMEFKEGREFTALSWTNKAK